MCYTVRKGGDTMYKTLSDHYKEKFGCKVYKLSIDAGFTCPNRDGTLGTGGCIFCSAQGGGEFAAKYLAKGRMAVVSGRLQIRDWTDKEGNKRRVAEVVADNIYFADSKTGGNNAGAEANNPKPAPAEFEDLSDDDGELPF